MTYDLANGDGRLCIWMDYVQEYSALLSWLAHNYCLSLKPTLPASMPLRPVLQVLPGPARSSAAHSQH